MPELSKAAIKRIEQAVKWIERSYRNPVPAQRSKYPLNGGLTDKVAIASGTITGRGGATAGKGSAVVQRLTVSGTVGTYSAAETLSVVWNFGPTNIPSGTWITLSFIDGVYQVTNEICP